MELCSKRPTGHTEASTRNLTPAEANEALADPARVVINPDPVSKSGRGVRIIGFSITAQTLLTVIVLEDEGTPSESTHGHPTRPTNAATRNRSNHMTKKGRADVSFATEGDLAARLAEESDAIEANPDAPITDRTTVTRGHGRTKVLQIRLNDTELAELERISATRGLPPSTVAREAILRLIDPEQTRQIEGKRLAEEIRRFVGEFMSDEPKSKRASGAVRVR